MHRTPEVTKRRGSYPGILRGGAGCFRLGSKWTRLSNDVCSGRVRLTSKLPAQYDVQFAELGGRNWEWEGTGLLTVLPDGGYSTLSLS